MSDPIEQQAPNSAGEGNSENTPEEIIAEKEAMVAELTAKKDELHGRATRAEEELKRLKASPTPPAHAPSAPNLSETEARIKAEVNLRLNGFSEDEVEVVRDYAKGKGTTLEEAAKSDFVKGGIETLRAKRKAEEATPKPTQKSTGPSAAKPLGQMTNEERRTNFSPEAWRAKRKQASSRSSI